MNFIKPFFHSIELNQIRLKILRKEMYKNPLNKVALKICATRSKSFRHRSIMEDLFLLEFFSSFKSIISSHSKSYPV